MGRMQLNEASGSTNAPLVESGLQLLSRVNQASYSLNDINPKLFQRGEPAPNQIIEISGDLRNELMLDFLARCILPTELNPDWKQSGVVLVSTNNHLNILRITSVIDAQLKHVKVQFRKAVIEKALTCLTILNCYNAEQFEMTLLNLETIVEDKQNVALLVVDDVASQYWIVKQSNEQSLHQYCKTNLNLLGKIVKDLSLVLVFSSYQRADANKRLDFFVDYYITADKGQCTVIDYVKNITKAVAFNVDTFITFT